MPKTDVADNVPTFDASLPALATLWSQILILRQADSFQLLPFFRMTGQREERPSTPSAQSSDHMSHHASPCFSSGSARLLTPAVERYVMVK